MIARTETHSAMNYGRFEMSKQMGFKNPVKKWISARDVRTRDWHRQMNTREAIAIDEKFEVYTPIAGGGSIPKYMDYTGDMNGGALNVINCRCMTRHTSAINYI